MRFKNCFSILLLIILLLSCSISYAQERTIEDLIEEIASNFDDGIDFSSLYDDLYYYYSNPINLNNASVDDLEKLYLLSDFQIKSLLDYIESHGQMYSVYELQLVLGFNQDLIQELLPFVTVSEVNKLDSIDKSRILKYGRHQLFLRSQKILEEQIGYTSISDSILNENPNSRYLGNQYKYYAKYKFNYKNKLQFGFTAEKDPGEEFFKGSNSNGFDFYSGHIQVSDIGFMKTITLGDYQAKFGQGLVIWSDMWLGKSPYVMTIRKNTQGLRKYSSTNENSFLRGAGTTLEYKNIDFTLFYSNKNIDANILDSTNGTFSSFQNSGLHTIPSEVIDKDAVNEQIIGTNITYNNHKYKIGITAINYKYSASLIADSSPENLYNFSGDSNSNLSLDYQFGIKNFRFFGEEAISRNGSMAFLNGLLVHLAPQVSLSALHRHFDKNYQASYSIAFSESSKTQNESGFYIGLEVHPYRKWKISAFYDMYKFPWLKSNIDAPSNGYEWFLQVDYNPLRNLDMYLRVNSEEKAINISDSGINQLSTKKKIKFRFHLHYEISEQISLKNRIETLKLNQVVKEYGYLIYQDLFYDFIQLPISINLRYALFDTDSYNSRIYAYESDILYSFSVPSFYLKGTRTYLNVKYSFKDYLDIWLKYSQTYYSNKDIISSGLNQINGNVKSELKVQLRLKF